LIGYIAFLDPPKESSTAPALKALAEKAGITVKVLTGGNEL
jgi:magnesium-transporting ATPase (P-type)